MVTVLRYVNETGHEGDAIVLLLCGGDKRKQDTDIERAIQYLADFKRRTK
ncbi:MAG TPA: hypothetical protein VFR06_01425 [Gallionellaceae bacterium]|nr:hypothetical protein [Gallionellaceae bacterium]